MNDPQLQKKGSTNKYKNREVDLNDPQHNISFRVIDPQHNKKWSERSTTQYIIPSDRSTTQHKIGVNDPQTTSNTKRTFVQQTEKHQSNPFKYTFRK